MPAEWEPHAATWLAWPHHPTDFVGKLEAVEWVVVEMVRILSEVERVRVIVRDASERRRALERLSLSGVRLDRVDFFASPTNRSWTRDFLPSFVVGRGSPKKREVAAVKWRFNGWARYRDHGLDERSGRRVAELCRRVFRPNIAVGGDELPLVLEGGAIDVDGEGTLLAEERCLLDGPRGRNPGATKPALEAALGKALGVEKALWVRGGIAGDDTAGHVDDFVRFVAPGRVVLCRETRRADPNFERLRTARASLQGARDARGRRLDIVDLPMPAPVTYAGERLPASYANFYLANRRVIVPVFNDAADSAALAVLQQLFPERRVIGVYSRDLVLGQGTLHCSTQQEPAGRGFEARFMKPLRLRAARLPPGLGG
jgi:agmatine deiminase